MIVNSIIRYALILFCLLPLWSCGGKESRLLETSARIVDERPDSAYMLLKNLDFNNLKDKKLKADYALTRAKANMYMGRSLVTDTLLSQAVDFYKAVGDTASHIESVIAQANHLRSLERKDEAWALIDRQIKLAHDGSERLNFEIKKITPLVTLNRSKDAVALCDSLFALPDAPEEGSNDWLYMRINYAAALGEHRETSPQAVAILKDVLGRMKNVPSDKLVEFYIPMVNLQLNSGNINEATKYVNLVDSLDSDIFDRDPVAASYLEFLKIVLDYEHNGALSLSRLSNTAHSLRKVSNDLEVKRQERDDALENAYDLSRSNYELTIRHQHLWLFIILIMLVGVIIVTIIFFVAHRRRQKLIEAEERIEALEQLAMAATKPSPDDKQALLKKTLLLQIDIIRAFAEAPTAHNQEALKKISNAGNSDSETDALVNWSELYPVIDELYDNFHANLLNDYPGVLSEREIQILCLLRAGFSTKEIGVLIQQTSNSVYVSKTSIRKKLGLLPKEDFIAFLTTRKPSSGKA